MIKGGGKIAGNFPHYHNFRLFHFALAFAAVFLLHQVISEPWSILVVVSLSDTRIHNVTYIVESAFEIRYLMRNEILNNSIFASFLNILDRAWLSQSF